MQSLIGSIGVIIFVLTSNTWGFEYRLAKDVVPLSYNLTIIPYFLPEDGDKRFTFYGETYIDIVTKEPHVREFAVHSKNLNFIDVSLCSEAGKTVAFNYELEEMTDKIIFLLKENLVPLNNYLINFKYTGLISDGFEGLFRSNYTDAESNERLMVASQMQRINARQVFPCFDEPSFKAYYNICISRPKNFRSFSNTAVLSTTIDNNDPNRYIDRFETTPYMSTYLVAMIVSEYNSRTDGNLFILSRPEFYNKTRFTQEVTKTILRGYNELFGIPYPNLGNKILQMASLPKFLHNGMENWGLTIYKDEVLVSEDNNTDLFGMQYSTTIISHETSHNWFGNALTFEWWGYFWLNEGFARYYQYFATNELFPQYELDKQFTVDQMHTVFDIDSVNSTQPLSEPNVTSPSEIARKFSSITYVKGACIIRMISHAMSETNFKTAIREYIGENLHRSVNPTHLLKTLIRHWPSTSQVDVATLFNDWTEQVGFPFLNVTLSENGLSAKIQQKRFTSDSKTNIRYTIPLTFTSNIIRDFNNTFPNLYFKKDKDEIILNFETPIEWIMFNIQQTGYYRVLYDTKLTYKLYFSLLKRNWSDVHELNRAQFVDDLFAFARVGLRKYNAVFKMLDYLLIETHYTPWKAAFKGISFVGEFLTVEEHENFGKYILFLTKNIFKKLGVNAIDGESVLDVYNRKQVLACNCKYGNMECNAKVENMLSQYLHNKTMIPIDIRSTVYCYGMRDATEDNFEKLIQKFRLERVPREKLRIRNGLGCVRQKQNMKRYFELILSDEVSIEEKSEALLPLYKENPENVSPVFEMVTSQITKVAKAFGGWSNAAQVVSKISNLFVTLEQRNAFEKFIKANHEGFGASRSILVDALAQVDIKLKWSEAYLESLRNFLGNRRF